MANAGSGRCPITPFCVPEVRIDKTGLRFVVLEVRFLKFSSFSSKGSYLAPGSSYFSSGSIYLLSRGSSGLAFRRVATPLRRSGLTRGRSGTSFRRPGLAKGSSILAFRSRSDLTGKCQSSAGDRLWLSGSRLARRAPVRWQRKNETQASHGIFNSPTASRSRNRRCKPPSTS